MRTTPACFFLSAVTFTMWLAVGGGCGGKVSVDGDAPDPSGTTATGMGGASATNTVGTTGVTAIAVGVGGAPVTSNVTVGSSMADGSPPPPDGPSVGAGPNACDFTGECDTCTSCAFEVACADEVAKCDAKCSQYSDCVNDCDPNANGCFMQCNQKFPEGHVHYADVVACLVCPGGACASDCAPYSYLCGK